MIEKEELQKMNKQELEKKLLELREQLRSMRFNASANQLKQVHTIKQVKKNIAQILTILRNQVNNS